MRRLGAFRLLPGIAMVLLLVACGSTDAGEPVTAADVVEPATAETHDPVGLPPRVESEIGQSHPSSVVGGAGNTAASGTNTNLNTPVTTESTTAVSQSEISVTQTPIATTTTTTTTTVAETPVETTVVERETIRTTPVDTTAGVTTTRTMTRKD
ncbi:MAG TPA: hypothetical protein VGF40_12655 [Thermoanaerobaculia bacterium]